MLSSIVAAAFSPGTGVADMRPCEEDAAADVADIRAFAHHLEKPGAVAVSPIMTAP